MKSQNGIVDIMRAELLRNYLGKSKAKKRSRLLTHCHYHTPKLKDRRMRKIYGAILPIAYTTQKDKPGIYVVDSPEEVRKAIKTIEKTIETLERKRDRFEIHEAYLIRRQRERGESQMSLFKEAS